MDRSNPYEAAFETFLREQGLCYVAVDEARRAVLGDVPVKNLDFIILGPTGAKLLVDVKGRQFPGGPASRPRYVWESWATQEDVNGLTHWQGLFGNDYLPLFVFMYRVLPIVSLDDSPDIWRHQGETYLFRGVRLDEYRKHMRVRSPKWGTVGLPKGKFEEIARPFRYYSHECPVIASTEENDGPDQARHLSEVTRAALQAFVAPGAPAWRGRSRTGGGGGTAAPEPDSDGPP
ncbi:MAG: HYExAFE family protein [Planctomycetes bacterium]|nr:HYExAFE family protein [Planctomycetota bacterium]